MILINPFGLIVLLVLAAPYFYGWLRIEVYSWVRVNFDENVAKAWAMPKYKHYLRYAFLKFVWKMIQDPPKADEEREYAKVVARDLFSEDAPKYVLEGNFLGGKHNKISSLWHWATWQIQKKTRLKWRV